MFHKVLYSLHSFRLPVYYDPLFNFGNHYMLIRIYRYTANSVGFPDSITLQVFLFYYECTHLDHLMIVQGHFDVLVVKRVTVSYAWQTPEITFHNSSLLLSHWICNFDLHVNRGKLEFILATISTHGA